MMEKVIGKKVLDQVVEVEGHRMRVFVKKKGEKWDYGLGEKVHKLKVTIEDAETGKRVSFPILWPTDQVEPETAPVFVLMALNTAFEYWNYNFDEEYFIQQNRRMPRRKAKKVFRQCKKLFKGFEEMGIGIEENSAISKTIFEKREEKRLRELLA